MDGTNHWNVSTLSQLTVNALRGFYDMWMKFNVNSCLPIISVTIFIQFLMPCPENNVAGNEGEGTVP